MTRTPVRVTVALLLCTAMYPSRRDGQSGLVKRIERKTGAALIVSRPWLDR